MGGNLKDNLLKMINWIWKEEQIPEELMRINIKSLYKGRGQITDLRNQRGLFIGSNIMKLLERMMLKRMKPSLEKAFTEEQAGGGPGRSTTDQLYILRAVIEEYKYKNKIHGPGKGL